MNGIETDHFDMNNIICYQCMGKDLQGFDTTFNTYEKSCFVENNRYDVYEIPCDDNTIAVLAHNTDFQYWIFLEMHRTNNTIEYAPLGVYSTTIDENRVSIDIFNLECLNNGSDTAALDYSFDNRHIREQAYQRIQKRKNRQ